MLAGTPERIDWLRMAVARGRYLGMDLELISPAEAKKLYPLLDEKHFVGALYDPIEGHVDPYGVTHAYAKSAQLAGAEIVRQNRVIDTKQRADGTWDVITEKGTIHAEHVVNAGGLWAREVGRFVGLELPILAMEHQYLITEDLPELEGPEGDCCTSSTSRPRSTCARSGRACCSAPTSARACRGRRRRRRGTSARTCCRTTSTASRRASTVAFEHFPRLETRRHQEGRQRPVHVRARRQPARRPGQGPAELLGRLRRHGRASARAAASACRSPTGWSTATRAPTSGRWTSRATATGPTGLHQRQGARELLAPLPHPLPERGAAGRAAAAHDADLRQAAGRERRVRRLLHARAPAVVRAEGHARERGRDLPPLERASRTWRRNAAPCARPAA